MLLFKNEKVGFKRYVQARAIVQMFVADSSHIQVNLSGETKKALMDAISKNNRAVMESVDFFDAATSELFEDLRKSDAFRQYLDSDTFSLANLE